MAQRIKRKFLDPEVIEYFDNQIIAVDEKLDQEIEDRQDGDTALGERIDAIESYNYDQVLHVSKNGLDTNTGGQHSPFLTITAALNAITDAAPSKRYAIKVMPGAYSEASLALKANVFIVGEGNKESIRITAPVSMHSSFSGNGDHLSGFHRVTLLSAANFDWSAVTSAAGKLYVSETVFGSTLNLYGHNNAIAQVQFNSCVVFGATTISGINSLFTNNVFFSDVTLNQHPNGGMPTIFNAMGGYCGNLSLVSSANDFNRRCSAFLRSFWSENLVSNGPVSYADVDLVSGSKQGAQRLNGGQVIALTPVVSHDLTTQMIVPRNTNAHNMGDWGKQWAWNFGYVHASTGTDLFLISYGSSFGADSSGKSIGIYTDGGGLQQDVDGGDIVLATAGTSGTGVRGIIQLNGRLIDVTSKRIINVADGVDATDAVNKGQLDAAIDAIPEVDLTDYYTKGEIDDIESALEEAIKAEKERVDAILEASDADKDSFAEIVELINSIDTENDEAFAGYVLSNDERVSEVESRLDDLEENATRFAKGSQTVGENLEYIDLDREYKTILSVSVGRLAVHEDEDYTVSVVGGVTRLTWINSLAHPDGEESIETGYKVFYSGAY
jgi:hypothetical protein